MITCSTPAVYEFKLENISVPMFCIICGLIQWYYPKCDTEFHDCCICEIHKTNGGSWSTDLRYLAKTAALPLRSTWRGVVAGSHSALVRNWRQRSRSRLQTWTLSTRPRPHHHCITSRVYVVGIGVYHTKQQEND